MLLIFERREENCEHCNKSARADSDSDENISESRVAAIIFDLRDVIVGDGRRLAAVTVAHDEVV